MNTEQAIRKAIREAINLKEYRTKGAWIWDFGKNPNDAQVFESCVVHNFRKIQTKLIEDALREKNYSR